MGALRMVFDSMKVLPEACALKRLACAILPVVSTACSQNALSEVELVRGDLLAVLHILNLVVRCRNESSLAPAVREATEVLQSSLATRFDATSMVTELRSLSARLEGAHGRRLQKRLDGSCTKSRLAAAAVTVQVLEAASAVVDLDTIARLADFAGLPRGDEEKFDVAAAKARARGDLFFEDTGMINGKGTPPVGNSDQGVSADLLHSAAGAVHQGSLEAIPGIEGIRAEEEDDSEAASDSEHTASKRKIQDVDCAVEPKDGDSDDDDPEELEEVAVETTSAPSTALLDALAEEASDKDVDKVPDGSPTPSRGEKTCSGRRVRRRKALRSDPNAA